MVHAAQRVTGDRHRPDPARVLSNDEMAALYIRYRAGGLDGRRARDEIVTANIGLVHRWVRPVIGKTKHLDYDDLLSEGMIGLLAGIERFEPERGFRFSTYVSWWIRQAIQRAVTDTDDMIRVPESSRDRFQPPPVVSIDAPVGGGESSSRADFVAGDVDVAYDAVTVAAADAAEARFAVLTGPERLAVAAGVGLRRRRPATAGEIGAEIGRSADAVRALQRRGWSKLWHPCLAGGDGSTSRAPSERNGAELVLEFRDPPPARTRRLPVAGPTRYVHGTRACYTIDGCGCDACTAANRSYARQRGATGPVQVPSATAAEHLRWLASVGVGAREVARRTGIDRKSIAAVRDGKRARCRRDLVEKVLALSADAVADGSLVPAGPTWANIELLVAAGWTRTRIAAELGSTASPPSLQLHRERVTAGRARAVAELVARAGAVPNDPIGGPR